MKDKIIDALQANWKCVVVLTSAVENEKDEILGDNNSNKPCENFVSSGGKNISSKYKHDNMCEDVTSHEQSMM